MLQAIRPHHKGYRQQLGAAPQQHGAGVQQEGAGLQQFTAGAGQQLGTGAHGSGQQTSTRIFFSTMRQILTCTSFSKRRGIITVYCTSFSSMTGLLLMIVRMPYFFSGTRTVHCTSRVFVSQRVVQTR